MRKVVCGITMGDPSGIGPEILLKALSRKDVRLLADYVVIADAWVLKKAQGPRLKAGRRLFAGGKVSLVDLGNVCRDRFSFGRVSGEYGRSSMQCLAQALSLVRNGRIDCLVTLPISKEAINLGGYHFSGHTEYIADAFGAKNTVMLMINRRLKVALVTRHIPLKEVSGSLSKAIIIKTAAATALGLEALFAIRSPRLALCALNPHGSDNGILGREENRLIKPALRKIKQMGISAEGPFPADTIFPKVFSGGYDAVVCMYHDQGLIPLKLTGFRDAVNITLGLPFVRTSPGHGTAFDIAGRDRADPSAFIEAIKTAVQCTRNLKKA